VFKINPDAEKRRNIINYLENEKFNPGKHCPCVIVRNEKSVCSFDSMYLPDEVTLAMLCVNAQEAGECHCELYIKK